MNKSYKKEITSDTQKFEGTKTAFANLISKPSWYADIKINGIPITTSNAAQMKYRFKGKGQNSITQDMMEAILLAAGYKIAQPIVWQK